MDIGCVNNTSTQSETWAVSQKSAGDTGWGGATTLYASDGQGGILRVMYGEVLPKTTTKNSTNPWETPGSPGMPKRQRRTANLQMVQKGLRLYALFGQTLVPAAQKYRLAGSIAVRGIQMKEWGEGGMSSATKVTDWKSCIHFAVCTAWSAE